MGRHHPFPTPPAPSPKRPRRYTQYQRRFFLAQLSTGRAFINPCKLHPSQSLCLICPAHRNPASGELLKPDRSSGALRRYKWNSGCHVEHNQPPSVIIDNNGGGQAMDAQDVLALGLGVTPPWRLVEQRLDTNRSETIRCSKPSARRWRRKKHPKRILERWTSTHSNARMEAPHGSNERTVSGRQGKSQRLPQHRDLHHHDLLDRGPARRYSKINLIRRRTPKQRLNLCTA